MIRIRSDTGDRGWVPAWFIGKLDSGSESNPSTATFTAGPRSAEPMLSASSTSSAGYQPSAIGGKEDDGEEIGFDGGDDGGAGVTALKGYL
jgi:hypothetical protein